MNKETEEFLREKCYGVPVKVFDDMVGIIKDHRALLGALFEENIFPHWHEDADGEVRCELMTLKGDNNAD